MFSCMIIVSAVGQNGDKRSFVFDTYASSIETDEIKDYSSHEFGDIIAKKIQVIENTFLIRYEISVGLTDSEVEVLKPDLLKSIERINKYYLKAVKKGIINKEIAIKKLSNYLDIAYTLFYEESSEFEKSLRKAKGTEETLNLYDRVKFIDDKIAVK